MPIITVGSSLAADMIAEAASEIEKSGGGLDLESNSASIPVMDLPNGLDRPIKMSQKKVYPNDPCPCGAGRSLRSVAGSEVVGVCWWRAIFVIANFSHFNKWSCLTF